MKLVQLKIPLNISMNLSDIFDKSLKRQAANYEWFHKTGAKPSFWGTCSWWRLRISCLSRRCV